jgi:hypothetical protein
LRNPPETLKVNVPQSTLGAYLSVKLNVPHIPLDEIAWKPGWKRTQVDEFKEKANALMAQDTRGWIVDGDYPELGISIPDNATDIICGFVRGSVILPTYSSLCNRQ